MDNYVRWTCFSTVSSVSLSGCILELGVLCDMANTPVFWGFTTDDISLSHVISWYI